MDADDTRLIARVIAHDDRAAYGELVQRHQSAVRRYLRYLAGGDATLADDVAQDTFVEAHRQIGRFRGECRFDTWLFGIARNHYRNAARRRRAPDLTAEPPAQLDDSGPRLADMRHDLGEALRELSPEEQLALQLGYEQGLSHAEIARATAWPLGTTKTHLARAKEKLRHLLAVWNPQT